MLKDIIRLSARAGKIPAEIPSHYVKHCIALHREGQNRPKEKFQNTPMVIRLKG